MATFTIKGQTYTQYFKPHLKGKRKVECIKYKKGYRNFWERISLEEFNDAKNGNIIPIEL